MSWLLKLCYTFWFRCRRIVKKYSRKPALAATTLSLRDKKTRLSFIEGVNLPWIRYGGDFGANAWSPDGGVGKPEDRQELHHLFRGLNERGVHTIRWFLLCDGRAGIRYSKAGTPVGPDHRLFADVDAALETAAACGLKIIFVLLDFLWFSKAGLVNGVQIRGQRGVIAGAYKQRALRRRVIKPLLARYGRSPVILAWDIVNEPEWSTRGCGGGICGTAVPFLTMRHFIIKTARLIHRYSSQLATIGLGNAGGLPLVRYTGLDFYQVHWYDRWERVAPLERPVSELCLDRPLLLGEFPTRNSARPPEAIVAAAKKSGYCGALAWSVLGQDSSSAGLQG